MWHTASSWLQTESFVQIALQHGEHTQHTKHARTPSRAHSHTHPTPARTPARTHAHAQCERRTASREAAPEVLFHLSRAHAHWPVDGRASLRAAKLQPFWWNAPQVLSKFEPGLWAELVDPPILLHQNAAFCVESNGKACSFHAVHKCVAACQRALGLGAVTHPGFRYTS